jgi:hypothetical protein
VNVWPNDGKANFTLAHTYQIPVPVPGNFGGEVVITGTLDLHGDGKIDLVGYVVDASVGVSSFSWETVTGALVPQ